MTELTHQESIEIARPPDALYALISDVTRMPDYSPNVLECRWEDGAGPQVGAWFTGRNTNGEREWDTRSQVVAADPARRFGWLVGQGWISWTYDFEPTADGTLLTESWEFLPAGQQMFRERYGEAADEQIADRTRMARAGIPTTLQAIKVAAEAPDRRR